MKYFLSMILTSSQDYVFKFSYFLNIPSSTIRSIKKWIIHSFPSGYGFVLWIIYVERKWQITRQESVTISNLAKELTHTWLHHPNLHYTTSTVSPEVAPSKWYTLESPTCMHRGRFVATGIKWGVSVALSSCVGTRTKSRDNNTGKMLTKSIQHYRDMNCLYQMQHNRISSVLILHVADSQGPGASCFM